jgi:hypothetical protein
MDLLNPKYAEAKFKGVLSITYNYINVELRFRKL